jgi:hypothetical protein
MGIGCGSLSDSRCFDARLLHKATLWSRLGRLVRGVGFASIVGDEQIGDQERDLIIIECQCHCRRILIILKIKHLTLRRLFAKILGPKPLSTVTPLASQSSPDTHAQTQTT